MQENQNQEIATGHWIRNKKEKSEIFYSGCAKSKFL